MKRSKKISCRRMAKAILDMLLMPYGKLLLRRHQAYLPLSSRNIVESIDSFPTLSDYHFLGAMQNEDELVELMEILKRAAPKTGLEIGTASGGTLFCWSHIVSDLLISVDLPGGVFGGGYETTRKGFYRAFAENSRGLKIELLLGDSTSVDMLARVESALAGSKLDFLFIDGDHTLPGVCGDLRSYLPFVEDGGLVAIHDICAHKSHRSCAVYKLWNAIEGRWNGHRIFHDADSGAPELGIGWFVWKKDYASQIWEVENEIGID